MANTAMVLGTAGNDNRRSDIITTSAVSANVTLSENPYWKREAWNLEVR